MVKNYLLIFSPVVIGIIVALINNTSVDEAVNKFINWLSYRKSKITSESGKFNKYFIQPFLWLALKVGELTDGITHSGIKSGVRIITYIYLTGLFFYISYLLVMLVLILIGIAIALWIVDKLFMSDGNEPVVYNTKKKEGFFGNDNFETRNERGKVISTSTEKSGLLGGKYFENRDPQGKVISRSEVKEKVISGKFVETRDSSGKVVSTSEEKHGLFGDKYVETKDTEGKVISTSEEKEGTFGGKYVETKVK